MRFGLLLFQPCRIDKNTKSIKICNYFVAEMTQSKHMSKPPLTTCQRKFSNPSNIYFEFKIKMQTIIEILLLGGTMKRPRQKPASFKSLSKKNIFAKLQLSLIRIFSTLPWSNNFFLLKSAIDISNYRLCLVFFKEVHFVLVFFGTACRFIYNLVNAVVASGEV